jgi:hypothetical protein
MTPDGQQIQSPSNNATTIITPSSTENDPDQRKLTSCIDSLSERIESALTAQQHDIKQQFHYVRSMLHHNNRMDDRLVSTDTVDVDELATANDFVDQLRSQLPQWIEMRSSIEVDEAIQLFAGKFYRGTMIYGAYFLFIIRFCIETRGIIRKTRHSTVTISGRYY